MKRLTLISTAKKILITGIILFIMLFFNCAINVSKSIATTSSDINVDVINGIAIRILDKTGQAESSGLVFNLTANPTSVFSSDNILVDVSTSNKTGYKLYASSNYPTTSNNAVNTIVVNNITYTSDLVHSDDTYTIPTLQSDITKSDFSSGSQPNSWGYSIDDVTFKPIPLYSSTDLLYSQDHSISHDITPVYIGININMAKGAGEYKNQLVFSAIGNPYPVDYKLQFNINGGTGSVETQTATEISSSHSFTVPSTDSSIVQNSNKALIGWSEDPTVIASTVTIDNSGSGTNSAVGINSAGISVPVYRAGDTITLIADSLDPYSANKTLYAIWRDAPAFFTISTMQEMTPSVCNSVYTPAGVTTSNGAVIITNAKDYTVIEDGTANVARTSLRDTRDNKSYLVYRTADGNCWMGDILSITLTANTPIIASTNSGTTFSYTPTSCSTNGACAINGNYYRVATYGWYYYPWFAATAGTGTTSMNSGTQTTSSICPKGWRLPSYSLDNKSWLGLSNKYNLKDPSVGQREPITARWNSGVVISGSIQYNTSYGSYWSSQPATTNLVYSWTPTSSDTSVFGGFNKTSGVFIRCVNI